MAAQPARPARSPPHRFTGLGPPCEYADLTRRDLPAVTKVCDSVAVSAGTDSEGCDRKPHGSRLKRGASDDGLDLLNCMPVLRT